MTDPELAQEQIERLAQVIFDELDRQIDRDQPNNSAIIEAGSLDTVLIEGRIDLLRVAEALVKRFGLRLPEIETVADRGGRILPRR